MLCSGHDISTRDFARNCFGGIRQRALRRAMPNMQSTQDQDLLDEADRMAHSESSTTIAADHTLPHSRHAYAPLPSSDSVSLLTASTLNDERTTATTVLVKPAVVMSPYSDSAKHLLSSSDGETATPLSAPADLSQSSAPHASASPPSKWFMVGAWIGLCVAIVSFSAVGPTFLYVQNKGVTPLLSACWRCQCMIFFLLLPAALEIRRTPIEERRLWFKKKAGEKWHIGWYIFGVSCCWAWSLALWVTSLRYTTTVRASLFGSLYPLVLVVYSRVTGVKVSKGEALGVVLAFGGVAITLIPGGSSSSSSDQGSSTKESGKEFLGDAMNMVGSALVAINIIFAQHVRKTLPVFTYSTINTINVTLWLSFGTLVIERVSFSNHMDGLFGWTRPELVGIMMLFGFVVGILGLIGFNVAVKHISAVVFSTVQLVDPALTGFIAWIWGLEGIPSVATFIGGVVVALGIAAVVVFEARRKRAEESAQAQAGGGTSEATDRSSEDIELEAIQPSSSGEHMVSIVSGDQSFQYARLPVALSPSGSEANVGAAAVSTSTAARSKLSAWFQSKASSGSQSGQVADSAARRSSQTRLLSPDDGASVEDSAISDEVR